VKNTARRPKITVSADGQGLVSQAGTLLLAETLRASGLGQGLTDGLARWRAPRAVHDSGKIITDLVATLALGAIAWPTSRCCAPSQAWPGRWPPTRWCPG
jgi:hypothetical protein